MSGSLIGFRAYFNSDGTRLDQKLIEALRDAEAQGRGKQLDLNMTIFQFQSVPIADELLRIARENPNARIRIIGDWSQSADTGNNQLPLLERKAAALGLANLDIRYKKDEPYQWDEGKERPVFSHARARGLVHRKGFVALVDGAPVKMAFGSFNWSETADSKNYEDLVIVDPVGEPSKAVALQYEREFAAFVNHPDALTGAQARAFKRESLNRMREEHGRESTGERDPGPAPEKYVSPARSAFDVNGFAADDLARLDAVVGRELAEEVLAELRRGGRFDSYLDLAARIPRVAEAPAEARQALAVAGFGEGRIPINSAPVEDWVRIGLPDDLARAIVDHRGRHDGFLATADLAAVPGMTPEILAECRRFLTDDVAEGFYTARGFDDDEAATGYDPDNAARTVALAGADDPQPASVTNAAVDLLRRTGEGDTVRIAMYIFQSNTPEFREMLAANDRGAHIKLVLSDEFADVALPALRKELAAGRSAFEVRVQTARTLHEKFMVAGNEVFTGSANIAPSASERHSEDRYVVRNHPPFARSYVDEFERVFARSREVE